MAESPSESMVSCGSVDAGSAIVSSAGSGGRSGTSGNRGTATSGLGRRASSAAAEGGAYRISTLCQATVVPRKIGRASVLRLRVPRDRQSSRYDTACMARAQSNGVVDGRGTCSVTACVSTCINRIR